MFSARENPSILSDFHMIVVIGGGLAQPFNMHVDIRRLKTGIQIAKSVSEQRGLNFDGKVFYAGKLASNQLPLATKDLVVPLHFEINFDGSLQAQILCFIDYIKKQPSCIKNIVIVSHAYQLERIGRIISQAANLVFQWQDLSERRFFLFGTPGKYSHREVIAESVLFNFLKNNSKIKPLMSKSNNIFYNNKDIIGQQSLNSHAKALMLFDSLRYNASKRIRELKNRIPSGRYLMMKLNNNRRFMQNILEFRSLLLAMLNYANISKHEFASISSSLHVLTKLDLFVLHKRKEAIELIEINKYFHLLTLEYKNIYPAKKLESGQLLRHYANAKHHLKDTVGLRNDIAFLTTSILKEMQKDKPHLAKRIKLTIDLAFLIRCKANALNDKEKAKSAHLQVLGYLHKLKSDDFNLKCEKVLNYLSLFKLCFQDKPIRKKYLTQAANYLNFNQPTLIQAIWYLYRAKDAIDDRNEKPLEFLDKAKFIIDNYYQSDENYLSFRYMELLTQNFIFRGGENYKRADFLRLLEVAEIAGIPRDKVVSQVNFFIKQAIAINFNYAQFASKLYTGFRQNLEKIIAITKFKEIFQSCMTPENLKRSSYFLLSYQQYQTLISSRGLGLFNQPANPVPKSAEVKVEAIELKPEPKPKPAESIARQQQPRRCCSIM